MKNEDFNTNLSSYFETVQPTILEAARQLFKREFTLDHAVIGSGEPHADIQNDSYPKTAVTFLSGTEELAHHVILLPNELVLKLYGWMVEADPDESVSDAHLEGMKEGADQVVGQLQAALDGEGISLSIQDMKLAIAEAPTMLGIEEAPRSGSAISYTLKTDEDSFIINHYLFTDLESEDVSESISDEEINKMLNGEDLDERISVEDDLGVDDIGVQQVEFGDFDGGAGGGNGKPRNIDMLLDVDLEVLVELGRKNMLIKEVLKLGKGSVIELDKAAGEPLGIYVNGRMLAEGEVVVVDDHFGIRITKLAGTAERIQSLG